MKFWATMGLRERRLVAVMLAVVVIALLYLVAFEPAWKGRQKLDRELPLLRQEVAQVDALAAEIKRTSAASLTSANLRGLRDEVERSLERAKLKATSIIGNDESLEVRLAAVPFQEVLAWQQVVQKDLRLKTARLAVARDTKAGLVTAQITLEPPKRSER